MYKKILSLNVIVCFFLTSLGPFLQQNFGFGWPSALGDGGYQVAYMFMMLGAGIGVYGSFVVSITFYRQATESLL